MDTATLPARHWAFWTDATMRLLEESLLWGTLGYRDGAPTYRAAGWAGVLPLPFGAKFPPPSGFTGATAPDPDGEQIDAWCRQLPAGNTALRLPEDVVGLDVDEYGGKRGSSETLRDLERRLGALPSTWKRHGRPGDSGVYLFRVPPGRKWKGEAGQWVEVIQRSHRYVMVPPSVHPEGWVVCWQTPEGHRVEGTYPHPADLAELPATWVAELSAERVEAPEPTAPDRRALTPGEPCRAVAAVTYSAGQGGRQAAMNAAVWQLVHLGEEGHAGVAAAVEAVGAAYVDDVADRGNGQREYERSVGNALDDVTARPTPVGYRHCCAPVPADQYEADLALLVRRMQLERDARARLATEELNNPPPDLSLREVLASVDATEPTHLVAGLMPLKGTALLAADAKAGKTTLLMELVRCAVDGELFLDRFAVHQCKRVQWVDFEMGQRSLQGADYFAGRGIRNVDAVRIEMLAGVSAFDPRDKANRALWAERLYKVDHVILDGFGAAMAALGIDENSASEVGRLLDGGLTPLMREADIGGLVVVHHTPHGRTTPRGSTRFSGWPDAIWTYSGDSARKLAVRGRDVRLRPTEVTFDPETRRLSVGQAKPASVDKGEVSRRLAGVLAAAGRELATPELAAAYIAAHGGSDRTVERAIAVAVKAGHIAPRGKRGRSRLYGLPAPS